MTNNQKTVYKGFAIKKSYLEKNKDGKLAIHSINDRNYFKVMIPSFTKFETLCTDDGDNITKINKNEFASFLIPQHSLKNHTSLNMEEYYYMSVPEDYTFSINIDKGRTGEVTSDGINKHNFVTIHHVGLEDMRNMLDRSDKSFTVTDKMISSTYKVADGSERCRVMLPSSDTFGNACYIVTLPKMIHETVKQGIKRVTVHSSTPYRVLRFVQDEKGNFKESEVVKENVRGREIAAIFHNDMKNAIIEKQKSVIKESEDEYPFDLKDDFVPMSDVNLDDDFENEEEEEME